MTAVCAQTIRLVMRPCDEIEVRDGILAVRLTRAGAREVYRSLSRLLSEDEKEPAGE